MVASISDEHFLIEMDPRATASATDDEDDDHTSRVLDAIENPPFDVSVAVSLAEAGLIRYFQPHYNEIFKNMFPGRRHKMLETLRELDLLGLVVELQSHSIRVRLGSDQVPTSIWHEAKYYIHFDGPDRRSDWAMRNWLTPDK